MKKDVAAVEDNDSSIEKHFQRMAERGIILSANDLVRYCKSENIKCPPLKELRRFRRKWKSLLMFGKWNKQKTHFMTSSIPKLGLIMVDLAYFKPRLSVFNKNCKYFLVGVDCLSQYLTCVPLTKRTRAAWQIGIEIMMKEYPTISHFITDRDTAVTSKKYQREIFEEYGIRWTHLPIRGKAMKAE